MHGSEGGPRSNRPAVPDHLPSEPRLYQNGVAVKEIKFLSSHTPSMLYVPEKRSLYIYIHINIYIPIEYDIYVYIYILLLISEPEPANKRVLG